MLSSRPRCLVCVSSYIILVLLLSACGQSGSSTKIAFTSHRDGNTNIYVMGADGTQIQRLTDNAAEDFLPAWSPDGQHLAFVSERDGYEAIYVMLADGTQQRRISRDTYNSSRPAWSPTGAEIAFVRQDGHEPTSAEIMVMAVDGTRERQLTHNDSFEYAPSWSSDGQSLAFVSGRDGNTEIYRMDRDGTNQRRLTSDPGADYSPAWSPDGRHILFTSTRDTPGCTEECQSHIYVMNPDGANPRKVTTGDDWWPAWSPDSQSIVFERHGEACRALGIFDCGFNIELYKIDSDGTNLTRLTNSAKFDGFANWTTNDGRTQ